MRDTFINAINTRQTSIQWLNYITENLQNLNTPGYRENQMTFKSYLDSSVPDKVTRCSRQGKAIPGKPENVFLEGNGYFVIRNEEGRIAYTRLGDFKFDGEGVYKSSDGSKVQGYILNDKGEIMSGTKTISNTDFETIINKGGALAIPTTEIKLWIDPDNGKFLGKYDEFEIKEDGILYGKANDGKDCTPLYKLAVMNFQNSNELFEYKQGQFLETEYSGKPVIVKSEIKSGSLEASNMDYRNNIRYWHDAQMQINVMGKMVSTYKDLLQTVAGLLN